MLAWFKVLVVHEEVLDRVQLVGGHVADILNVIPAVVAGRNTEQFVVAAGLVDHLEHGHRPYLDENAGVDRLGQQHHRVQRVAVLTQCVLDESVVRGIPHRCVEVAVQPQPTGLVVDLVLVALTLRDFDGDVELHPALLCCSYRPVANDLLFSSPRGDGTQP